MCQLIGNMFSRFYKGRTPSDLSTWPTFPAPQPQPVEVAVHDWPPHVLGIDAAKHRDPAITAEHTAGCEGAGEGVLNPEGLPPVPGRTVHLHRRVGGHEAPGPSHQHQVVTSVGERAGAESWGAEATLTRILRNYYRRNVLLYLGHGP